LPSATATAEEIRRRILADTGLTASAGISYNKLLAKLASDVNKPNGQCVVTPANGPRFVAGLPIGRFHGIGPATAAKMARLGIHTGADLARWSLEELVQRFGKAGRWYHGIARAEDGRAVTPDRPRKSYGSETTFESDLLTPAEIGAGVARMAADVAGWIGRTNAAGRTVTVKARFADFQTVTRSRTAPAPVTAGRVECIAIDLVRTLYPPRAGIRLLGVTLSGFDVKPPAPETQMAFEL
jgi:DNA polymerase IV